MNKIERFRAMLRGEPVDRVPAGFWFHFDPAHRGGEAMARAHLDYYRATDLDVMKVMNDTGYAPIGRMRIERPEDWVGLEPTPLADPLFQSHLDGLKRIVDTIGDEVMVMTTAFNPYNQAIAILRASADTDSETARSGLLAQLRANPSPVKQGLQVIAEDLAGFLAACITEAGARGIYYSAQGGERATMSDEEHADFFRPYDLVILNALQGVAEFVVGHFCGQEINLARFSDYPVDLINWAYQAGNLSLPHGKALFGGKPVLGGMDERGPLVTGPREAIRAEVEWTLGEMGTRGFMLGAGCTVPGDIDVSHLTYARQAVSELSARYS